MHRPWIRSAKFLSFPLLGFVLLRADTYWPFLRFSNELANVVTGTVALLLPFITVTFALFIPQLFITRVVIPVLLLPLYAFAPWADLSAVFQSWIPTKQE